MAQGRSTKIISMMRWIRTRRLSTKNSLSYLELVADAAVLDVEDQEGVGVLLLFFSIALKPRVE